MKKYVSLEGFPKKWTKQTLRVILVQTCVEGNTLQTCVQKNKWTRFFTHHKIISSFHRISEKVTSVITLKCAYEIFGSPCYIRSEDRRSHLQIFFKIGVLEIFVNSTGKHLCWSLFLIKAWNFIKRDVLLWNLWNL